MVRYPKFHTQTKYSNFFTVKRISKNKLERGYQEEQPACLYAYLLVKSGIRQQERINTIAMDKTNALQ